MPEVVPGAEATDERLDPLHVLAILARNPCETWGRGGGLAGGLIELGSGHVGAFSLRGQRGYRRAADVFDSYARPLTGIVPAARKVVCGVWHGTVVAIVEGASPGLGCVSHYSYGIDHDQQQDRRVQLEPKDRRGIETRRYAASDRARVAAASPPPNRS